MNCIYLKVIEDKAEQIDNKVLDEDALERKRNYGRRLRGC